jgi:hypothetical protein
MTADRAEWTGVGAALAFHIALIVALSTSLASFDDVPEQPSIEVELVDEVGLQAAAPIPIAQPSASQPAASQPPPMPSESRPAPLPEPMVTPLPTRPEPAQTARPTPQPQRPQARAAPQRPAPRAPAKPTRRAGIGDDFLKSFDDDLSPRAGPSQPTAPTYSAKARTNVANSIASQAQRCADRQVYLGEGADQLKVQVRLSFARSGRLARPPSIGAISGDSDLRAKFGDLLEDQVRRIFAECAPFRLPAELYDTDNGGWKETTLSYRVRK